MLSWVNDVRFGARMQVKRPGLSLIATVALGLGIGLTTTMFSIVYGAVMRGLPYDDSDELVGLVPNRPAQGIQFLPVSIHDVVDRRKQIVRDDEVRLAGGGELQTAQTVPGQRRRRG